MSFITHLCTQCGHPDIRRTGFGGAAPGRCACGCNCTPGEPEVRPSFDLAGRPVERVNPPGKKLGGDNGQPVCGCPGCKALYEQLAAAG